MDRGDSRVVELEEGWRFLAAGVAKIRRTVEADGEFPLSGVELLELYTTVFDMCTQKPPQDYSGDLYERYKEGTDNYVKSTVFNEIKSTVTATVIGMITQLFSCYGAAQIDDEREGKSIDRDLLNNVLDIFFQTGDGNLDIYRDDFEQTFFNATTNYYSRKAQTLNKECSDHDYMLKVEECLQKEKERVAHYLHSSTEPQLMEAVRSALTTRHAELKTEA
ncbi:cullin-1-like [Panicum miliaceum]|uniref:Cullin-1-like n=1 Tax=Panicum miliaceum TaxID=4540 RepID=A0A3L6QRH5_PANMI|nr:cullin-1-like [Panicum miliaceum]